MPDRNIPNQNLRPNRLRRWKVGDPFSASHLNEAVEAVMRLMGGANPAQQVVARGEVTPAAPRMFRVLTVEADYIRCESQDGTFENDGNEDVWNIAKPYLLRRTPFEGTDASGATRTRNGITYSYADNESRTATLTATGATEDQAIVPSYQAGDILYAIGPMATGVRFDRDDDTVDVEWLDLNTDGRTWGQA